MPYEPDEPWLLPFIQRVRTRPGMYLGAETARQLCVFLDGYTRARIDLGIAPFGRSEEDLISGFDEWIASKLGSGKNIGWCGHVEQIDPSDRNIQTFFRMFDEYLGARGIVPPADLASRWPPST